MGIRVYEKQEKQAYIEDYKKSGETLARYALENGIPETTLRGWIKEDRELKFGAIEINASTPPLPKTTKSPMVKYTPSVNCIIKLVKNSQVKLSKIDIENK